MTTILELALLSLDAYNRNGDGLDLGDTDIGNWSPDLSSAAGGFFAQATSMATQRSYRIEEPIVLQISKTGNRALASSQRNRV